MTETSLNAGVHASLPMHLYLCTEILKSKLLQQTAQEPVSLHYLMMPVHLDWFRMKVTIVVAVLG